MSLHTSTTTNSPSSSTPPPTASIYSSALFRSQTAPAAAYSVFLNNGDHHVQLSQPLTSTQQAYTTALLQGLLSSLELASSLQLPDVQVFVDDDHLVRHFRSALPASASPTARRSSHHPNAFSEPANLSIWNRILSTAEKHLSHGGKLLVSHAPNADSMRTARLLARKAIHKHIMCTHCRKHYGPRGTPHKCSQSSAPNSPAHREATDHFGRTEVFAITCPSCSKPFCNFFQLEKHVETHCPEVLEHWFAQTKIVKK